MNILFLYTRMNGFLEGFLEALGSDARVKNISVVHNADNTNGNLFTHNNESNITYYARNQFTTNGLFHFIDSFNPTAIYVSGWVDKGYISAVKKFKSVNNCKVIVGIDDQWRSSWRQRIGSLIYRILYKDKVFDFMWVSGPRQYYYARRFGHNDSNIIFNLLSADERKFTPCLNVPLKRFLYVGRFDHGKGVLELAIAFSQMTKKEKNGWKLHFIGAGPLKSELNKLSSLDSDIILKDYMQPTDLASEMSKGGVGCLLSSFEQWGVVVHEYCHSGLPLFLTIEVGSASSFAINKYNSFIIKDNNVRSISKGLLYFCDMNEHEFNIMSNRSLALSSIISLDSSCGSFLSVFTKGSIE